MQIIKNGITMEYVGSGNSTVNVSAVVNESLDTSTTFTISTTNGSISHDVVVTQEGKRELFDASDGEYILKDGDSYNVLKEKYKNE